MNILFFAILILNIALCFVLVVPFLSVLFSRFFREKSRPEPSREIDFACIITAYKNAGIVVPLIDSFLKQHYDNFRIYLVADQCDLSNVALPLSDKITVLQPPVALKSKVKSIIYAMDNLVRPHEAVVILDPDNLGDPGLLAEFNRYFHAGYKAVQGRRVAKNLDSVYACLDATSELYFNYTMKYVPYLLKSSANISGSGMAIETELFKSYLNSDIIVNRLNTVIVAEDKILQNFLVGKDVIISFAKDALLYDEKVASANQVVRQRTRWINSYFENVKHASTLMLKGLSTLSINKFLFGLLTALPPMFIIVISSACLLLVNLVLFPVLVAPLCLCILIFISNFMLVLYLANAPREIWKNLYGIPVFMMLQIAALFKMKKANKDFLVTEHKKYVSIENMINKRN